MRKYQDGDLVQVNGYTTIFKIVKFDYHVAEYKMDSDSNPGQIYTMGEGYAQDHSSLYVNPESRSYLLDDLVNEYTAAG